LIAKETLLLSKANGIFQWKSGPKLAVAVQSGCLSKASWSKEEYFLLGINKRLSLKKIQLQLFINGSWSLLSEKSPSKLLQL